MVSTNGSCLISNLPSSFEFDIKEMAAAAMEEAGVRTFTEDYRIKIRRSILTKEERRNLPTEIVSNCQNSVAIMTEDRSLGKEEYESLTSRDQDGESGVVVIPELVPISSSCHIQVVIIQDNQH